MIAGHVPRNNYSPMPKCESAGQIKNPIYTKSGKDLIDEAKERYTVDEFRGAMRFLIEKYLRRLGEKDTVRAEVRKIADYANRWLEYENEYYDKSTDYRSGGTE